MQPFVWWTVAGVAIISILVANLVAVTQMSIKKLLAWSSIAHAGFALLGLLVGDVQSTIFYVLGYTLMTILSFVVVLAVEQEADDSINGVLAGLGSRKPFYAFALTVALLTLAGMPPLVGFFGKFFVIYGLVEGGYIALSIFAMLTSAIGFYYYFRVIVSMYFKEGLENLPLKVSQLRVKIIASSAMAAVLLFGMFYSFIEPSLLKTSTVLKQDLKNKGVIFFERQGFPF